MAGIRAAFAYRRLLRDPWRSRGELLRLQDARLRRLVRHAYAGFDFYRDRFRRDGVRPEEIQAAGDLRRLSPVGKEELRAAISSCAAIPGHCRWASTSGSSGAPMRFPFLPADDSLVNLGWLRPLRAHGIPATARILVITGPHNIRSRPGWYQRLGFWRREFVSIFAGEARWLEALNDVRPDVLWGYSGSLKLLARFIEQGGRLEHRPRWLVGVSDLVDDECRERVRRVFQTDLIDLYGASETGCISWLCPECREYHVNIDQLVVEFAGTPAAAGDAEARRIYVTNLRSYAFPILRYEIGDLGLPSATPPRCGRGLPLMRVVEGRSDAAILLPSGRLLSPMFFFTVMKTIPGMEQWQVIQEDRRRITVKVVAQGAAFSPAAATDAIARAVAAPMQIAVEVVTAIPAAANGKQRAVISQLHEAR